MYYEIVLTRNDMNEGLPLERNIETGKVKGQQERWWRELSVSE